VPSATSATLKADPAIPVASSRVYAALRLDSATPFNRGGILGRRRALSPGMTCRLRHLSPEALAPDGLCYSVHHRLIGLIRQSGGLRVLSRTPVMDTVLDIRGSQHPVSFAFATALLVARLAGLTRPEGLNVPSASRGFYFRAFRSPGRPERLPDITTAPN
jgi:hypothetical protein